MPVDHLVVIGRLGRPHGVQGEIRAHPTGPTLGGVRPGDRVVLVRSDGSTQRDIGVEEIRATSGALLVRFAGISTREAAAALTGATVRLPPERLATLSEPDEFFVSDLIGCVVTAESVEIGAVVDVHEGSVNDSLMVRGPDGVETLIPFTRDAVEELDMPGRRIRIRGDLLPRPGDE